MPIFCGVVAALGFLAAVIVHALSIAGVDVSQQFPGVWLLHIGCLAVFVPFVLSARSKRGTPGWPGNLFANHPPWVFWLGASAIIYAYVNFALFLLVFNAGTPDILNGEFVLHSHGKIIRRIAESEYHLQRAHEARMFSGHWMMFYLLPALHFLAPAPSSSISAPPAGLPPAGT
jgi:hypothetical protein